jgi:uncharacterized membrane protein
MLRKDSNMATDNRSHWTAWLGGIALGAAVMYVADPIQGKRRRALAQVQIRTASRKAEQALRMARRDAEHRLQGLQAQASNMLGRQDVKPIDDHVLEARVSSKIGRKVSNWHAIDVDAHMGCVTLSGPILAEEKTNLLELVQGIPGVTEVRDELDVYDDPGNIPDLQGYYTSHKRHLGKSDKWSSSARLMAALGGGLIGYYGLKRPTASGRFLVAAGLGLLARSLGSYEDLKTLVESGKEKRVTVQKSIEIKASPETVFDIWSKYENFPQFMSYVEEVRDLGDKRSHWSVKGPLGISYEWESVLTEMQRPSLLAWKSEPDAEIENSGSVRLEPSNGGTRVTVELSYSVPGGVLGDALATMMGRHPEQELENDLNRMKEFIESSASPADNSPPAGAEGQVLH